MSAITLKVLGRSLCSVYLVPLSDSEGGGITAVAFPPKHKEM